MHRLGRLALPCLVPVVIVPSVRAQASTVDCDRCHGDREFLVGKRDAPGEDVALYVPQSVLRSSRHRELTCRECHTGYDDAFPHQPGRSTASCQSCHGDEGRDWAASSHAASAGNGDSPTCVRCHGAHDIVGVEDRASPIHPLNEAGLCGDCHGDSNILATYFTDPADSVARSAVERYHETVHGLAVSERGLVVSATCSDCHSPHRVLPADSSSSSIHRDRISDTCGACHLGVVETYRQGAHGTALLAGTTNVEGHGAPVCTDCHAAHGVAAVDEAWRAGVVDECGACHERLYETYFETYHGKVTRLGGELTAKCADCHTAHGNLPAHDPRSSVHASNLLAVCSRCHQGASDRFVQYHPHGDPHDRDRYPKLYWPWTLMSSLLIGVFGFFGTHTVLWLARGVVEGARGRAEGDKR
jgi:hypothetical protein